MRIIVKNKKERELIESMLDVALKVGGIRNLADVVKIKDSIENGKRDKSSISNRKDA